MDYFKPNSGKDKAFFTKVGSSAAHLKCICLCKPEEVYVIFFSAKEKCCIWWRLKSIYEVLSLC